MAINNPQAIRFINEVVRPMAEKLRALKAEVDSGLTLWDAGLDAVVLNDDKEPVDDNRQQEGISRINGKDVVLLIEQMRMFSSQLGQPGVSTIVEKPCVRPLKVQ